MAKNETLVSNVYYKGAKSGSAGLTINDTSLPIIYNFSFLMLSGGNFYPQDNQFSPPHDQIVKARCYVTEDFNINNYDFWYDQPGVANGLDSMTFTRYDTRAFFFDLKFSPNARNPFRVNFYARYKPSGVVTQIYTLLFLPTIIEFPIALTGVFQGRHDVMTSLKTKYPSIYPNWYRLSPVTVTVPRQLVMLGRAFGDGDHWLDNCPLIFTSAWDPEQIWNLNVAGCVIGYGGKGGNAGYSYVDGYVKYVFSLPGYNGGNPVFVDDSNNIGRKCRIFVLPGGMWEAGGGGGGAGVHTDPGRLKPWSNYGMPGSGGMPNGQNGQKSPYQRRTTLGPGNTQTQNGDNRPRAAQYDYLAHMNYIRFFWGFTGFHETGSESQQAYQYQFGGWGTRFTGFNEDGNPYPAQGFHPYGTPPGPTSWGDRSDGGWQGSRVPLRCEMVQDASEYNRRNLMIYHFENGATFEIEAALGPWITANLIFESA